MRDALLTRSTRERRERAPPARRSCLAPSARGHRAQSGPAVGREVSGLPARACADRPRAALRRCGRRGAVLAGESFVREMVDALDARIAAVSSALDRLPASWRTRSGNGQEMLLLVTDLSGEPLWHGLHQRPRLRALLRSQARTSCSTNEAPTWPDRINRLDLTEDESSINELDVLYNEAHRIHWLGATLTFPQRTAAFSKGGCPGTESTILPRTKPSINRFAPLETARTKRRRQSTTQWFPHIGRSAGKSSKRRATAPNTASI